MTVVVSGFIIRIDVKNKAFALEEEEEHADTDSAHSLYSPNTMPVMFQTLNKPYPHHFRRGGSSDGPGGGC